MRLDYFSPLSVPIMAAAQILLAWAVAPPRTFGDVYQWSNFAGQPGGAGNADGTGSNAEFAGPGGVAVDASGNVYVADTGNNTIRIITSGGVVKTLAGSAVQSGRVDGAGGSAMFYRPIAIAIDGSGNLYVADSANYAIRKITGAGVVTTLAGGRYGSADGTGSSAQFADPSGVAADTNGNVYVADTYNYTIRKITPGGVVTTMAGSAGLSGSADGSGIAARFNSPSGVAVDGSGNVYVADTNNCTIRKITPGGVVTTLAGSAGQTGSADGTGSAARFNNPEGLAVDGSGNLYVPDTANCTIRKVMSGGVVTTLAGSAGQYGSADGTGGAARFNYPGGVAIDSNGNVYVADTDNYTIRTIASGGIVTTLAGSVTQSGSTDGSGSAARFLWPQGVALDRSGNLYVADSLNCTIRMTTPEGVVTTVAGSAGQSGSVDGTGNAARFYNPVGVAVDGGGNLYVADTSNNTIRKIASGGVVTTVAGSAGKIGSADGTGSVARFNHPEAIAVDSIGNLYVADEWNQTIRKITSAGVVTTLAGSPGPFGSGSADGPGSAARFGGDGSTGPSGVAVDARGNVYVSDTYNRTVRMITSGGVVTTLAGSARQYGSVDGTGSGARFSYPDGIGVDGSGNVYVSDFNGTIRMITSGGVVTTIGGTPGIIGGLSGVGPEAQFDSPWGLAVTPSGVVYVGDTFNNRISIGLPILTPTVTTFPASNLTLTGATLNGTVSAKGLSAAVSFDYGTTTAYGMNVVATPTPITGTNPTQVSAVASGLTPGVTYHFRVAGVAGYPSYGVDQTFTAGHFLAVEQPAGAALITGNSTSNFGTAVVGSTGGSLSFTIRNNGATNLAISGVTTSGPNAADFSVCASGVPSSLAPDGSASFTVSFDPSASGAESATLLIATGDPVTPTFVVNLSGGGGSAVNAAFTSAGYVPLTTDGFVATGDTVNLSLKFAPAPGTVLTLIQNAGTSPIKGFFSNLSQDQIVAFSYNGVNYQFIADYNGGANGQNLVLRLIGPVYQWSNFAGDSGTFGSWDGTGAAARFSYPSSIAIDGSGNLYVTDTGDNIIRKITSSAVVTTIAGSPGPAGNADGTGSAARFSAPFGIAVDGSGNVYVADSDNSKIRLITSAGVVSTLAGSGRQSSVDGPALSAAFYFPTGVAVDRAGNVYVADSGNDTIREITNTGIVITLAGSATQQGSADGTGNNARFFDPNGVAVDASGNLYIADTGNDLLRKITSGGIVTTLAGSAGQAGSADGTGSGARFNNPYGIAVDGSGTVYVADRSNATIRMITSDGVVTTIGGTAAGLNMPLGVAITPSGSLFVADAGNYRISLGVNLAVPTPMTLPPAGVSAMGATLNGAVSANNLSTAASFDYGTTTAYGTNVAAATTPVTGLIATPVSAAITGLVPGTIYHFRVTAVSGGGAAYGFDQAFVAGQSIGVEQSPGAALASGSSTVNFGAAPVGASDSLPFTIENLGTATLNVGGVTINGTNGADFSANTSGLPGSLAVGASASFTVAFAPSVYGSESATLRITTNDPITPAFTVNLSGEGANALNTALVSASASSPGDGAVTGGDIYAVGDTVTVTAAPYPGFAFSAWTENGRPVSFTPTYSFTVANSRNLAANFVLNTFSNYLAQYLSPGQLADANNTTYQATVSGDGIANLMKYALALNPAKPAPAGALPVASILSGALTLTYTVNKAAPSLVYVVEVSNDLMNWNTGSSYTSAPVLVSDGVFTQIYTVSAVPPNNPARFIRLRVSAP